MIIGVANSKGGVGKSKLACNFLDYLNARFAPTALVDAEKGGPTAKLLQKFDETLVARSAETLDEIDDSVSELTQKGFHVIIDAPGKEGDQVSTLCLLSDLVIIPMCVSQQDLLQTVPVMKLVLRQQRRSAERKPDAVIVFTRTLKNDIAAPKLKSTLAKFGIPIADSEIREIVSVKRNISVMRQPRFFSANGPANDFANLINEVVVPRLSVHKRTSNE